MKKLESEKYKFIFNGIFSISVNNNKAAALLYPEMDEESYALVESLRERVAHAGKQMLIEEIEAIHFNALLVAQTEQVAIFIQDCDLYRPRFIWMKKDKIRQLFFPTWVMAEYLKHGRLPGPPEFISGLEWEIQPKDEKFWLTCINPPINEEITYSALARRFQSIYPEVDKPTPPPSKKQKDESEGKTTFDLNPPDFGRIK